MQRKCFLDVAPVDELIDFPVGVARDIAEYPLACGALVQTMYRHDRKELFNRPTVRHALEQREITEVSVGQHSVQTLELFREKIELACVLVYLAADRPI